jgi:hypothetical protein
MTISSFEQKREVAFSPPKEDETMSFLQEIFADLFGLLTFQHRAILHGQSDHAGFRTFDRTDLPKGAAQCKVTIATIKNAARRCATGNDDAPAPEQQRVT